MYPSSTTLANGGAKDWAYKNQRYVLKRYLKRRGLKGEVVEGAYQGSWRVKFDILGNPRVSIVIPTRDKVEYLKRAVESIQEHTKYSNYEIVIVNNRREEEETKEYFKGISMDVEDFGYEEALVNVRNYLAVTGACLMIKRKVFYEWF